MKRKRICAISIDMDPIDHYLHARGYQPLKVTNLNAVYDEALPRFLDLFDQYDVRGTFFIVGKDAILPQNRSLLRQLVNRGHEVANHTYNHKNFGSLSYRAKKDEITEADRILSDCVGRKLRGFRAPGWGIDMTSLEILEELQYSYDSSVLPSRVLRLIAFANRVMNKGRLKDSLHPTIGRAPKVPYHPAHNAIWKRGDMNIVELPTTVLPLVQLPFLGTSLYLLGKHAFSLSFQYFQLFQHPLFYILHGIELVDYYTSIQDVRLNVKPGLTKPLEEKLELYKHMLSSFRSVYEFITMEELAEKYT